jgi:hypothetical protein
MDSLKKMTKKLTWAWSEYPIGFPTDPDDGDFQFDRTPPMVGLALSWKDGDLHLRQGVRCIGSRKELTPPQVRAMKRLLLEWLKSKIY